MRAFIPLLVTFHLLPAAFAFDAITLDGSAAHHVFDGIGGLSAGASSRLLWDYPPALQSDILDFLYKPKFGANLQICKVEIGGDCQSTDGTEPSHQHTRDDLSCNRGYEFWLMKEARARNPGQCALDGPAARGFRARWSGHQFAVGYSYLVCHMCTL